MWGGDHRPNPREEVLLVCGRVAGFSELVDSMPSSHTYVLQAGSGQAPEEGPP